MSSTELVLNSHCGPTFGGSRFPRGTPIPFCPNLEQIIKTRFVFKIDHSSLWTWGTIFLP